MFIISPIFNLYTQSVTILFVCLGCMVALAVESLDFSPGLKFIRKSKLLRWKAQYLMICDLINEINHCFRIFLLIFITAQFLRMILQSFYLMKSTTKGDLNLIATCISKMAIELVRFIPLVYIPHHIKSKVYICMLPIFRVTNRTLHFIRDFQSLTTFLRSNILLLNYKKFIWMIILYKIRFEIFQTLKTMNGLILGLIKFYNYRTYS